MDTDRNLIKKWKVKRDMTERKYTEKQIIDSINKRENDYYKYIDSQKSNADIIINFFENNNDLKCKFIIKNDNIYLKLSKYLIKYNYCTEIMNDDKIIYLQNNITDIYSNENISKYFEINDLNNYYNEILILLILYIYN